MISPIFSAPTSGQTRLPLAPRLTLLTNPASTGNRASPGWHRDVVAEAAEVTLADAATPETIALAVRACIDRRDEILVVNGGDGTADLVFSNLITAGAASKPALFILPSGKTNMTTAAWCGATDNVDALRRLMTLRHGGDIRSHVRPRTILEVRRGGDKSIMHGAFFGAADVVDGILMCRRSIYPLGLPNAISHAAAISLMSWRALLGGSGKTTDARWPGGGEAGAFFFVGVTSLDRLILGLSPIGADRPGQFAYLSLGAGPRALLAALPSILSGRLVPGFRRMVHSTDRVTLRFDGAFTLDGELYEAEASTPIEITATGPLDVITLAQPS